MDCPALPLRPMTDEMLMMDPARCFIIFRANALVIKNTLFRLTDSTRSQSSSFILISSVSRVIPALLTRISSRPSSPITFLERPVTVSESDTSATIAITTAPEADSSSRVFSSASPSRSQITTLAPSSCKAAAMDLPIPRAAPVTSAVFPSRSFCIAYGLLKKNLKGFY